jgi:hypothetical protein
MEYNLLEKHENAVIEMANTYLENMEFQLAKKYQNNEHQVNSALTNEQYTEIKNRHNIPNNEFADLYSDFQKMKPTSHLLNVMGAFTKSGGSVDIEPEFDEENQRLHVKVSFIIEDKTLDTIEGLSPIEDLLLKMDAMHQIETVLSGSDSDIAPTF